MDTRQFTNPFQCEVRPVGASALIAAFCREVGLYDVINRNLTWDEKQWKRSPGFLAEGLIINILTTRTPLYRVEHFYQGMDMTTLFGPHASASDFNDDAIGRMLDRLAESNCDRLYSNLVLQASLAHKFSLDAFHGDTTSISVYGEYPTANKDNLLITHGYNKDGRFECKQIVMGSVVNSEGIPVLGTVGNGNLDDVTWNQQIIDYLPDMFRALKSPNSTYVADSKLVTTDNLELMADKKIKFISRLPNIFGLAETLKDKAYALDRWQDVGTFSAQKDAATYKIQYFQDVLGEKQYRFIVAHSSKLDQRKAKSLDKVAEIEEKALQKICNEASKQTFACEADALTCWNALLKKHKGKFFSLNGQVISESFVKRRPGRPKQGEVAVQETVFRIKVEVSQRNESAWQTALARASTFVLITNVLNERKLPAQDVLMQYKNQNSVEMRFRFLKNPTMLDGIYVQKPERVKALGYLFLMALLIFALMERRVRKNLAAENRILDLGYRKVDRPTGMIILDEFKQVGIVDIYDANTGHLCRQMPSNITDLVKDFLYLSGFNEAIYSGSLKHIF